MKFKLGFRSALAKGIGMQVAWRISISLCVRVPYAPLVCPACARAHTSEPGCFHTVSCTIRKSPTHVISIGCATLYASYCRPHVGAHDSGYGLSGVGVGNSKSLRYKVPAPDPICCDMTRTRHEKS